MIASPTNSIHKRAFALLLVVLSVFVLLLSGPVSSAQALQVGEGSVAFGLARCQAGRIFVHQPEISPAQPDGYGQKVAIRVHLAQETASGPIIVASDVWKTTWVTNAAIAQYRWTTLDGRAVEGTTTFTIPSYRSTVRFKVFTEYYWYADQYRPAFRVSYWNPHQDDRLNYANQKLYTYCQYPVPNDITMIG